MSNIKVFTTTEALEAVNTNPDTIFTVRKKKSGKAYKGTEFLDALWNIDGTYKEGWFSIKDVPLSSDIADPANKEDKRNEFERSRLKLTTTRGLAGDFGQFLDKVQPLWEAEIARLTADGIMDAKNRTIHPLMQYFVSDGAKENPGAPLDDPRIRFQIDFGFFPAKHPKPFLRNAPKTTIYDARTEYLDGNGRVQYELATVTNDDGEEEPLTADNVHKFVTAGSRIVRGRVMMPSVAYSMAYVSIPMLINNAVIMPGSGGGFTDDDDEPEAVTEAVRAALANKAKPEASNSEPKDEAKDEPKDEPNDEASDGEASDDGKTDVEDMLNDL